MHQQLLITLSPEELETLIQNAMKAVLKEENQNNNKEIYPGYLTIDQASAFTHIAKPTLYDYTHRKKIPFKKVGKRLLFSKVELEKWIEEKHSEHRK